MKKENLINKVFTQLTWEHLKDMATDIIKSQLQPIIIIDSDGAVWITYPLSNKPRCRRDGELLALSLDFAYDEKTLSSEELEEKTNNLAFVIKDMVEASINWVANNSIPANYWDWIKME